MLINFFFSIRRKAANLQREERRLGEAGTLAITKNKPDKGFGCRSENFKMYIRIKDTAF